MITDRLTYLIGLATGLPWHSDESELAFRLHGRAPGAPKGLNATYQILKAPKDHPTMEPYWPKQADGELIVEGMNALPYLVRVADAAWRAREAFKLGQGMSARMAMDDLDRALNKLETFREDPPE